MHRACAGKSMHKHASEFEEVRCRRSHRKVKNSNKIGIYVHMNDIQNPVNK